MKSFTQFLIFFNKELCLKWLATDKSGFKFGNNNGDASASASNQIIIQGLKFFNMFRPFIFYELAVWRVTSFGSGACCPHSQFDRFREKAHPVYKSPENRI